MSDPKSTSGAKSSLARERLIWATRPLGFLGLALWVLHPSSAQGADPIHLALIGFLVGLFYGMVVYGRQLQNYISHSNGNQRFTPNRVPDEYFWGNIEKIMYDNR
ncbi:MAG: hypothetical protein EON60_00935 [Alphaproteobacteria bacterium]|nr:MAG: hypothetical protein EON60_00935 [Alphaproteobacteria bacterium]